MPSSIRRFLLVSLLAAISVVTITAAMWTYYDVLDNIDDLLDGQLVEAAHILRRLITHEATRSCLLNMEENHALSAQAPIITTVVDESFPFYHHKYEIRRVFQVWSDEGILLIKS